MANILGKVVSTEVVTTEVGQYLKGHMAIKPTGGSPIRERRIQMVEFRIPQEVMPIIISDILPAGTVLRIYGTPISEARRFTLVDLMPPGHTLHLPPEYDLQSLPNIKQGWGYILVEELTIVARATDKFAEESTYEGTNFGAINGSVVSFVPFMVENVLYGVRVCAYPMIRISEAVLSHTEGRDRAVYVTMLCPKFEAPPYNMNVFARGAWRGFEMKLTALTLARRTHTRGVRVTAPDGAPVRLDTLSLHFHELQLWPAEIYMVNSELHALNPKAKIGRDAYRSNARRDATSRNGEKNERHADSNARPYDNEPAMPALPAADGVRIACDGVKDELATEASAGANDGEADTLAAADSQSSSL